jgi:hypothetical protein
MIEVLNKMSRSFIRPLDFETQENKSGIRKHFLPRSGRARTIRQAKILGKMKALNIDGLVKSPSAALRCNFVVAAHS